MTKVKNSFRRFLTKYLALDHFSGKRVLLQSRNHTKCFKQNKNIHANNICAETTFHCMRDSAYCAFKPNDADGPSVDFSHIQETSTQSLQQIIYRHWTLPKNSSSKYPLRFWTRALYDFHEAYNATSQNSMSGLDADVNIGPLMQRGNTKVLKKLIDKILKTNSMYKKKLGLSTPYRLCCSLFRGDSHSPTNHESLIWIILFAKCKYPLHFDEFVFTIDQ